MKLGIKQFIIILIGLFIIKISIADQIRDKKNSKVNRNTLSKVTNP